MAGKQKMTKRRRGPAGRRSAPKSNKNKTLATSFKKVHGPWEATEAAVQLQLKQYEEALGLFQQQKFLRAKQLLDKVVEGLNTELGDRARVHLRICEQRLARDASPNLKTLEDYYTHGIAMMNVGRWDDARESLERAHKVAPKADHVVYAMAALDCLTGEADSAMERLKFAIRLRPENRYMARNDPDFVFLQDDPRFTELLYPERDGAPA
jgi:tetratricopeptide (TPR) repeat protein